MISQKKIGGGESKHEGVFGRKSFGKKLKTNLINLLKIADFKHLKKAVGINKTYKNLNTEIPK